MNSLSKPSLRHIRSYVLREGRLTNAQNSAIQRYWSKYCLTPSCLSRPDEAFPRPGPITLEIGFGDGSHLAALAESQPEANFLGIEVYRPGIGHLLQLSQQKMLNNIRIIYADAALTLPLIAKHSIQRVLILFPDPWHKRKHHKRRLITAKFLTLLSQCIRPLGEIVIATDCDHYAHCVQIAALDNSCLRPMISGQDSCLSTFIYKTRFAQRARRKTHAIHIMSYLCS